MRNRSFLMLLWGMALLMAVVLAACQPVAPPPLPTPIPQPILTPTSPAVQNVPVPIGFGAKKGYWEVYFTNPPRAGEEVPGVGGIDVAVVETIKQARVTLDIVAFEWNNVAIHEAVLAAHQRGVRVRMAVDNEHTVEDDDSTLQALIDAGIPVVFDNRSALMHNKFMIIDGFIVLTGSTNFTMNDVYRNNNNILILRSRRAAEVYQAEFNEMFVEGIFGPRGSLPNDVTFVQDGTRIRILFSPEDPVIRAITDEIDAAKSNVKFMAFSFTEDIVANALLQKAEQGIVVEGIFETRGSETQYSRLRKLFCAGMDARQDTNPRTMHHKVFIIDDQRVLVGSFNFSKNATDSNDENMIILYEGDLAQQYVAEYYRVKAQSRIPDSIDCE